MADADLLGALIAYLKTQSAITALCSTRIYGQELPGDETGNMPRKNLVLRYAGMGLSNAGRNDYVRHGSMRIDAWYYGETFYQCDSLRRAAAPILKQLVQQSKNSCLIHNASKEAGPISLTDPDRAWPIMIETYSVFYSEVPTS